MAGHVMLVAYVLGLRYNFQFPWLLSVGMFSGVCVCVLWGGGQH